MIESALQALDGAWKFLILITQTAPAGVWSFVIAAVFPAIALPWLKKGTPKNWHPASRDFILETIALVAGIALAWLPWQTLQGLLVGIMAGFASPYLCKGVLAVSGVGWRWWHKRLLGRDPDDMPRVEDRT